MNKKHETYNIAKKFSSRPAGRTEQESNYSGEAFLKILIEELKAVDMLTIDTAGLRRAGSSFLEESFGGIVRHEHFTAIELHQKLSFKTDIPFLEEEIWHYIDRVDDPSREGKRYKKGQ